MGVIDAILGGSGNSANDEATDEKPKYAILLNAGPDDTPAAGNAFNYAFELDEAGYEVQLFLDGEATKWPAEFADEPDRPFSYDWERIEERGLLAGACGYCANAFDVAEACELADIQLLSDADEHAPAVPKLAAEGYEMLTIG